MNCFFSLHRSDTSAFTSAFPDTQPSSFSPLPIPDCSDASNPQAAIPPVDYPAILSSPPTITSPSSTTPSLQQTSFIFPTPPPSISSSPQPLLPSTCSSPSSASYRGVTETAGLSSPSDAMFAAEVPAGLLLSEPLQVEPVPAENHEPSAQSSAVFAYPNVYPLNAAPAASRPLSNPVQPGCWLPRSRPAHGGPTSFAFPSITPHMQSLSFQNVPPNSPHPTLHLPSLNHQTQASALAAAFPPCSLTHPSSPLPHPPFQPSCLPVTPSFQQPTTTLSQTAQHPQKLSSLPSSTSSSYPPADVSAIPQFNPAATYCPERVLHHPSLLDPSLTSTLPSSTSPPALYPAFPSYPLRLCQEPHSTLSVPFRHLYRRQHGAAHPQGSYLDVSTRGVF